MKDKLLSPKVSLVRIQKGNGFSWSRRIWFYCGYLRFVTVGWISYDLEGCTWCNECRPKRSPYAVVFEELPYKEAAEMTYYGASVIHPKTVKPLANKGIPLLVKSFIDSTLDGTKIHECIIDRIPPLIVHKENQCLISCKVTDYSLSTRSNSAPSSKRLAKVAFVLTWCRTPQSHFHFAWIFEKTGCWD